MNRTVARVLLEDELPNKGVVHSTGNFETIVKLVEVTILAIQTCIDRGSDDAIARNTGAMALTALTGGRYQDDISGWVANVMYVYDRLKTIRAAA